MTTIALEMTMERACFLLRIKKERLADYLKAHDPVWPEMLDVMRNAGIRNYSLFVQEDGLIVGYMEGANIAESLAQLGATDVNRRWQERMAPYFEGGSGDLSRDKPAWLRQYFHMP